MVQNNCLDNAVLKTLIYSDIFSYPLTKKEIWKYLIWQEKEKLSKKEFNKNFAFKNYLSVDGYYFLAGKRKIVKSRIDKKKFSILKKEIAEKTAGILKKIPTIKLIGISGSLSLDNSGKNDDIDLFIIAQKNTLWFTRALSVFLLEKNHLRRKPEDSDYNNKICLNMLVDENNLEISKKEQNLYIAHEVIQMFPLYEKDNIYQKFLSANSWVLKYLPNSINCNYYKFKQEKKLISQIFDLCSLIFDFCIMIPQLLYMKKRKTKEIINKGIIKFHPLDNTNIILNSYNLMVSRMLNKRP